MGVGRNRYEQSGGIHDSCSQVRRENIQHILPRCICKTPRGDQSLANRHEYESCSHERNQLPPARHDCTCNQATQGHGQRRESQTDACFGSRILKDNLEEEGKHEEILLSKQLANTETLAMILSER
jgi:hypothetical protein